MFLKVNFPQSNIIKGRERGERRKRRRRKMKSRSRKGWKRREEGINGSKTEL